MSWKRHTKPRTASSRPTRSLTALVVGVATLGALAGCSGGPQVTGITPAPRKGQALTAVENGSQSPTNVLAHLARQLRTQVEGLRTGLPVRLATQFLDERQECTVGAPGGWPAQWILDERLYLTTPDARAAGRQIAERYAAQGWTVQAQPAVKGADQYSLQREGFVISISAAAGDGSLDVHTNGPCVNSDGTIAAAIG